jgi:drug/metabolite transporter (DMT)-like permease
VNPAVAVLLGWAGGGEALTARELLASATIIAGVALIITHRPSPVAVTPDTEGLPAERPES